MVTGSESPTRIRRLSTEPWRKGYHRKGLCSEERRTVGISTQPLGLPEWPSWRSWHGLGGEPRTGGQWAWGLDEVERPANRHPRNGGGR